ncbi:hypothetical protein D3C84_1140720 [compost metagenome]
MHMGNERMREEFEAAYVEDMVRIMGEGIRCRATENTKFLMQNGEFQDPALRLAFWAWPASRESLVVKSPEDFTNGGSPNARILIAHHREIVGRWVQSIEAAGVKVKP